MERDEIESILRHLVRMMAYQESINNDVRALLTQQEAFNRQQEAFNKTALAQLEALQALVARVFAQHDNGNT